jgi:hypothetical protein
MSLFGTSATPSTLAAKTEEKFTRARYNQLRENFRPIENEILGTLGKEDYIQHGAQSAGRSAERATTAMQERGATDIARRGVGVSGADQSIINRNNKFAQKTNRRVGQTMGEMAGRDSDRIHTAGAVDAGQSLMQESLGAFRTASGIESAYNAANAGSRPGLLEKFAGVAGGVASGFTLAGTPGAVAGGALSAASMF